MVGHGLICHDGGGVGVDEDDLNPLLLEGAAGLGAGVVKLGRLTDDDGAGADDQYLLMSERLGIAGASFHEETN